MSKYAEGTSVPVGRSQSEIKRILERYDVASHRFTETLAGGGIEFNYKNYPVQMMFRYPGSSDFHTDNQYMAEKRRLWRVLTLHIKSIMEMEHEEMFGPMSVMMPFIALGNGVTVGTGLARQVDQALETGALPQIFKLLPESTEG